MNQFYALPDKISSSHISLKGQEAQHASKVMRMSKGEIIYVTDGEGTRYKGEIEYAGKNELRAVITESQYFKASAQSVELCLGLIRKRDRLEFAAEKATELGATRISLFKADHTEPFNVRVDRIKSAVLSAMKQSLRVYLPKVEVYDSLDDVLNRDLNRTVILQADAEGERSNNIPQNEAKNILMVVGPEGGLSGRECELLKANRAQQITLGDYRLRAETAAIMMTALFGNKKADREKSA